MPGPGRRATASNCCTGAARARGARAQQTPDAQAKEAAPPLLLEEALGEAKSVLVGTVATPDEQRQPDLPPPAVPSEKKK